MTEAVKFTKPLCAKCNLDGDCCCQKSQDDCYACGMGATLDYNDRLNEAHQRGRNLED